MSEHKIKITPTGDGSVSVGGTLSEEQRRALNSIAPTADDILKNIEGYNKQIEEMHEDSEATAPLEVPQARVPRASNKRRRARDINRENDRAAERKRKMNLDKELEDLDSKLEAEKPAEAAPEGTTNFGGDMDMKSQILELLKDCRDAPNEQQIAQWKAQYGQNAVHVMALGEGDVYVFTHLKRGQWKKIQEMMAKLQEGGANKDIEDELKEKVLSHCCLWPQLSVEFFYNSRAGVADSLYQVILLNSYFLSPQQAMLLTTQL